MFCQCGDGGDSCDGDDGGGDDDYDGDDDDGDDDDDDDDDDLYFVCWFFRAPDSPYSPLPERFSCPVAMPDVAVVCATS